jgi:modulator of FtsH protease
LRQEGCGGPGERLAKRLPVSATAFTLVRRSDRPYRAAIHPGEINVTDRLMQGSASTAVAPLPRIVRNTYLLLSMVMAVAAIGAFVGLRAGIPFSFGMWLVFMVVFIGGPFAINAARQSDAAIWLTFAWAGLVGFLLSPLIAAYLSMPGGATIVTNALGGTAVLFVALSAIVLTTRRDFSFLGSFLMAGTIVALVGIVAALIFQIPLLAVTLSAFIVLLISGFILYDTSRMIHDGNANPVHITVALFGNIVVLFTNLLSLMSFFSGED